MEFDIKIASMKNDGSQSWIVIRRGMNKYVTELPEENLELIHFEEVDSSTRCDNTKGKLHSHHHYLHPRRLFCR